MTEEKGRGVAAACCAAQNSAGECCPAMRALSLAGFLLRALLLASIGAVIYWNLGFFSRWLSRDLLGLAPASRPALALEFFLFETPKILLLLVMVVFCVGVARSFFTPERTRQMLSGQRQLAGNVMAALLGVVTPFCSCSAVPLFLGFVTSGVPLGVTFSFLIAAPMVNEVALVLLFGLFGWKVAALYLGTGLLIALAGGWILGRLRLERYIEAWVFEQGAGQAAGVEQPLDWLQRLGRGTETMRDIVGRVWIFVVLGIGVGAWIHGYVPEGYLASIMGKGAWWSVPVAVLVGVPMYSNAPSMVPVVQALLGKGAALGTVLAFMMSVIGLSLPEAIILRKVLKLPLILLFFGIVAIGIILVGYLFNLVM